mgnify:CR=1 FL=1
MVNISKEEMETIMHCRKTFLHYNQNAWVKKENSDFDVSMGSLDSAEVCELVGLFLLNKVEGLIPRQDVGLYRDDGLAVTSLPGPDIERLNKSLKKLFKTHGLTIEIQSGMKTTNFLDVTLYLDSSTFRPYRKDNKPPIYIKNSSNHPPHIKKELPRMISKRITQISSNKEIFKEEAPVYNTALENSGFSQKLQYSEEPVHQGAKNRRRKREVLWFNPPWNDAVATNVAAKFLRLVDKHFGKQSPYHRIFNRSTIKVSYSCMPNMAAIIAGHNKRVLGCAEPLTERGCNCRGGANNCILDGKCQTPNIVYKCTVTAAGTDKEYIGLSSNPFKQRYSNHKGSFTHQKHAHSTALSTHIWDLKSRNIPFSTKWSIQKMARPYSKETQNCQLCLTEKTLISLANTRTSLNKRNEIVSKCRHRDKWLLKHW